MSDLSQLGARPHVRYVVRPSSLDGWIVYGVQADGWHDRVAGNLSRDDAERRAADLNASVGTESEPTADTPSRGPSEA